MKYFIICICCMLSFSSCMTTKTTVGTYKENQNNKYTYAKGKQLWAFWGLIPLNRTNVNTPSDGNCQVVTRFNLGDFLISGLTGGLITSYSIKVKAKKEQNPEVKQSQSKE